MKFGLLAHERSVNLGDHIQSLAARQFLPRVDCIVERERLSEAAGLGPLKLIMNGWWMKNPDDWPPPPNIIPLFVSFHVTTGAARDAILADRSLAYLRKHEPIGCRDFSTMRMLLDAGVDAYFSGCLTMTFPRRPRETAGTVLFVDALRGHFAETLDAEGVRLEKSLWRSSPVGGGCHSRGDRDHSLLARIAGMPEEWCDSARVASAQISRDASHDTKFDLAGKRLEQYAGATIVVTSRLHALLPAVAMGIPCMFVLKDEPSIGAAVVNRSDQGHDCTRHDPRLSGLIDQTHHVTLSRLLDGLPVEQWVELAAESPCHESGIVESLSARVRDFIGE